MNNNLFQTLCSVRSFCCRESIFSYLRRAVFILSQAKSTTNRFLEFFLKLLSRYNRLSKKSFVRFSYGAGPVANLSLAWPLRSLKSSLRSLRNSCNSISRQFQWVFQKLCHLLVIFLVCSRSPCRSLLISKPTRCKIILSSSFILESRTKTDKLFFLLWRHSLPKSREKQ